MVSAKTGPLMLMAATAAPSLSKMGEATQRTPWIISSSSTA
ncbi:MAG: hypothetical protein R2724_02360 [Bryobacterales bacterium]